MSIHYSDAYEFGMVSECCGADVWIDICESCKEHCTPVSKEELDEEDNEQDD